ncbi:MAG: dipeptidase E [Candidatus Berkelbacteria bacterium Gr01-1014_85]|uniref:Dipeptidase E n=1 Tax=Candidatus Berkelbacteria bacterium Gr01-1014_85 TaxID=2017150 RepID=A0A554JCN3_9BACT|nr:MAG: dipeptidase E [Candidatus Berkelbacteria bacterium Gr01-1014_85]
MKKLFLTSSVGRVANDIATKLEIRNGTSLVFVTTASETETDDLSWRDDDRQALVAAGFNVTDYTFTDKSTDEIKANLKQFDVICIEGGNTFYLLEKIQQSQCQEAIIELVSNGMPYIGSSAGSMIAGPNIHPLRHLERDHFPTLDGYEGLGLIDFVIFPHWGRDDFKDLYLVRRMKYNYNDQYKYILLTDNQYLQVTDNEIKFIDIKHDKNQ